MDDPFADEDYVAGHSAQQAGNLVTARQYLEKAAARGNAVARVELCEVCFDLNDIDAVREYAADLEVSASESAEASYAASKAFEFGACFDVYGPKLAHEKRKQYLIKAAELGNPVAQLELAMNVAYGLNDYDKDLGAFDKWAARAAQVQPLEAAQCYLEVATNESLPVPEWVFKAVRGNKKNDA